MKKFKFITKLTAYILWNYLVRIPAYLILCAVINLSVASAWTAALLLCFFMGFKFDKDVSRTFALCFITPIDFWDILKVFVTLKYKEEN